MSSKQNPPVNHYEPDTSNEALAPITLSEAALLHVEKQRQQHANSLGLRFGVRSAGCTGYKYHVEIAEQQHADDLCFPQTNDLIVLVDRNSYPFVKGTHIDYQTQGLNQLFVFDNPNIQDQCGCGESFNIKTDQDSTL